VQATIWRRLNFSTIKKGRELRISEIPHTQPTCHFEEHPEVAAPAQILEAVGVEAVVVLVVEEVSCRRITVRNSY
jgi:peroxiredoxin